MKMLQLLAGFEGDCKAAHRVRRGSWRRGGGRRGGGRRGGGRRASRRWRRGACEAFFRAGCSDATRVQFCTPTDGGCVDRVVDRVVVQ